MIGCEIHEFAHQFWQLKNDPIFLLSDVCKEWIIPKIDQLGRRFQLQDFE